MKLELRRAADGAGFVICIVSERMAKQIVVPLSQQLSVEIERMVKADGIADRMILPPKMTVGN